ncbi:MAG TPA: glycosyl hydrolase family 28-related protein, partial [Polyangia bacterium]|nr:glycosyl hydrolase family 28-related protein [Polyangia bacterium]
GTVMGGVVLGPTRTVNSTNDIAAEASGRRAVRLGATNAYVEFKNLAASNSIVVRYSIPDAGPDSSATLSLYVDGKFRQKLKVTSRYSWSYGGANDFANTGIQNNPGAGNPHHFFDDTRALVGDIPVGAMVRLQKDADDSAPQYDIDLIDMEQVPGALGKPAGFVSLTECGAIPNDGVDDSAAIQRCVVSNRNVYVPEGTFDIKSKEISLPGTTIRGAGMWRSVFSGFFARFDCYAEGCKFYDFAINGDTTGRDDSSPETAFTGNRMSGAVVEHIWVEHKKLGVWPGPNTSGLTVRNSRFRNLFADGINLACGTSNAVIEHVHVRNSGDDAFASWSQGNCTPNRNNVFRHVFAQLPWRANCFGIYGGSTTVEDSVCADTVQYPGVLVGRMFDAAGFGTTRIAGLTLTRAGGPMYGQQGAIKLNAEQGAVQNIQLSNIDIDSPTYSAIHLGGGNTIDTVSLSSVTIRNPGGCGILAQTGGAADASNVVVTGTGSGLCNEKGFNFIRGAGNSGW